MGGKGQRNLGLDPARFVTSTIGVKALMMKIRVTSRSGEDTVESMESNDLGDFGDFLHWLSTLGKISVHRPGTTINDPPWGTRDPVDDHYTVHLIDEYD